MNLIIVCSVIMVVLFALSFTFKRRFGVMGLALAAGSVLSGIWSYDAGIIAQVAGAPSGVITKAIVSSFLVLLPAIVLFFHGKRYKTIFGRIIGAALFSVLAMAFLVEPLGNIFSYKSFGSEASQIIERGQMIAISVGLIIAVLDNFFAKKPVPVPEKHRKH